MIFDSASITGGVQCWGRNYYGALGDGTAVPGGTDRTRPNVVRSPDGKGFLTDVVDIDVGSYDEATYNASCAITSAGAAYCWGFQDSGELGNGITGSTSLPSPVSGVTSGAIDISEGTEGGCVVLSAGGGTVKCWGNGTYGIGDGTTTGIKTTPLVVQETVSVATLTGATQVDNGEYESCAVVTNASTSRGAAYCWGRGSENRLGNGSVADKPRATLVTGLTGLASEPDVKNIQVGAGNVCATVVNTDATTGVRCWGYNVYGELGDGTTATRAAPVAVLASGTAAASPVPLTGVATGKGSLGVGLTTSCAIKTAGGIVCWGYSGVRGEMGTGTVATSTGTNVICAPVTVASAESTTCTATVIDKATVSPTTPTGTVGFAAATGSPLVFAPGTSCTLVAMNATSSRCTVTVSKTGTAASTFSVTGTYAGNLAASSGTSDVVTVVSSALSNATTTAIACTPATLTPGSTTSCKATVTDTASSGAYDTGGMVTFSGSAISGVAPTPSTKSCSVTGGTTTTSECTVTIKSTVSGASTITASYSPYAVVESTKVHKSSAGTASVSWNTAPIATGSTRTAPRGASTVVNLVASDTDGDPLTFSKVSAASMPAGSTTTCTSAGACTLAIAAGTATGSYSFTWQVTDGTATSSTVTETVTVTNAAPVASAVTVNNVQRGRPASEAPFALTATDANGDALTYSVVTNSLPASASLNCSSSGACTVSVPSNTAVGNYTFTFKTNDNAADSNTATVTVGVGNTTPVATNVPVTGSLHTTVGAALDVTLAGEDFNGDTLTYNAPVAGPSKGAVTGTGTGRTYTAGLGTKGADTFTYTVSDNGPSTSAAGTVSILIDNTAPAATAQSLDSTRRLATPIQLAGTDVNGDPLTFSVVDTTSKGVLSCDTAGACSYRANTGTTGDDTFTFVANDGSANSAAGTVTIHIVLPPAPTISGDRSPAANANGWNNEPVTVSFSCSSASLASCTAPSTISVDGAGQSVTGTATDTSDQSVSTTVSGISIDTVAPTIGGVASSPASAAGWYHAPVSMQWTCDDALSGIGAGACPSATATVGEGTAVSVTQSVTDRAGNTTTATSEAVKVDQTPPSTGVSTPPTWSNSDVVLTLSAADGLSGVDATYSKVDAGSIEAGTHPVVSGQGHHTVEYWSVDLAGNMEAHATVGVDIDTSAPSITGHVSPAPNANGWNRGDVDVTFTCDDADSGVATCTGDESFSTQVDTVVTGHASDVAGNTATATATVRIDLTAPTVTAQVPPANSYGWFNTSVQVPFSCSDAGGSGIGTCPAPVVLAGEGADQPVTATGTDNAGNDGTASGEKVNLDLTAPTISGATVQATNGTGGYYGNVTVHWTCTDALSGIVSCPADETVSGEGVHTLSGSVNDKAGNTSSADVTFRIDHDPATDPGIVHGVITDASTGLPVKGATVGLVTATLQLTTVYSTKTGTDGSYTFPIVNDGNYKMYVNNYGVHLQAWYPNKSADTQAPVLPIAHGTNLTANQALTLGYVLQGTLTSGSGAPIGGATVRVQGNGAEYSASSDATGRYAVTGMVAGSRTVSIYAYGYMPVIASATIPTVTTMSRVLPTAATTAGIKGTITSLTPGGPLGGATVRVWLKKGASIVIKATTSTDGRFSIPSMPAGDYEVDVVRGDYQVRWYGDALSRTGAATVTLTPVCTTTPDSSWGDACATPVNITMRKP